MTTPDDLPSRLHDLIGPHGLLDAAYRVASSYHTDAAAGGTAQRWHEVRRMLQDALGVVAALEAGTTAPPSDTSEPRPCLGCGGDTIVRVYNRPWHHACWYRAGSPVDAPNSTPASIPADSDQAANRTEEQAAQDTQQATAQEKPAGWQRRKTARAQASASNHPEGEYEPDPVAETAAFARAVRSMEGFEQASDEECAAALDAWHNALQVLGRPFRFASSDSYSGVLLYDLLAAANGAMVQPEPLQSELVWEIHRGSSTVRTWSFTDPAAKPQPGEDLTELDVTGQYLAAAASTECGDGEPDLITDPDTLRAHMADLIKRPGYVQLAKRPNLDALPTHARHALARVDAEWWLPIPLVKYLHKDHGIDLAPAQAVIWPKDRRGQRLKVWTAHVNNARLTLEQARDEKTPGAGAALAVLKAMYASFLGGMLASTEHNDRGTLRPDWRDMVIAQANCNAWRAWDKAIRAGLGEGTRLLGSLKDAFWLVSPAGTAPARPAGLTYADLPEQQPASFRQPGKWRVARAVTVTEGIAQAHADDRAGLIQRRIRDAEKGQ
ncbi:hypothetical protein [Amycolatopsis sp. ATCC 39116]|uniref:hypothetical protein n=1 Tax=Amycolatopsis sp. (strain ATCC 39116 / 75iv2) TaxID=385957 RepID=UPI0002625CF6|nr:hypothetical protein [Amycolatopsis sp. ATCC 39116]